MDEIVTPITPYLICDHYFSDEVMPGPVYIGFNLKKYTRSNDLLMNNNLHTIKEGQIIQVSVNLFYKFVNELLPKIKCKIVVITSQYHLPQIQRNELTDNFLKNEKIILWISQNPIYENNEKYMAFPYGINHYYVDQYKYFLERNEKNLDEKNNLCYNSPVNIHRHLKPNHIRRKLKLNNAIDSNTLDYENYLQNILNSKFTISTSGDRDDCYRHYECIGLNSIPISDIKYKEIFEDSMIYSDLDNILQIINNPEYIETKYNGYNINKGIIKVDYWLNKISERLKKMGVNKNF